MSKVRPYLMRPACDKVNFKKCKIISLVLSKHTIRGYHGAAALKFLVRYLDSFCVFIFLMISREPCRLFLWYANGHAKIKLFKLSVFNFLIKHTQTFSIFAHMTMPPVLRSILLQRAGAKDSSSSGRYSPFS